MQEILKLRNILFGIAALVLLFGHGYAADTLVVAPAIKSVTVFGNQAKIRREVTCRVDGGMIPVLLTGLPVGMTAGSARAGVISGSASVIRLAERTRTEAVSVNDRVAGLEAQIDSIKYYHYNRITDLISVLEAQQSLLQLATESGNDDLKSQARNSEFDVSSWRSAYNFLGETLTQLTDSLRVLKRRKTELDARLDALNSRISELRSLTGKSSRVVAVDLDVAAAGEVKLYLEYLINGAMWKPIYDFRLFSEDSLEIRYYGDVSQWTGEDWKDVELTLSTSRPSFTSAPGDFTPRYLATVVTTTRDLLKADQPANVRQIMAENLKDMPLQLGSGQIHIRGGRGIGGEYVDDGIASTVFSSSSQFATSFSIKYPQTVLAGSESIRAPIATYRMPCELSLLARPSNHEAVFRLAHLKNDEDVPLLPGVVHLFAYADYLGAVTLPDAVFPDQEFEVPFGSDNKITLKRDVLFEEHDKKGDTWKAKQRVNLILTNNGSEAKTIRLEEAIPVSQDKAIKIEIDRLKPEPLDKNFKGMVAWEVSVPAGETRTFEIAYKIEYPANTKLRGL